MLMMAFPEFPSTWLKHVHSILDHSGLSFIWINKKIYSISGFKNKILQRLKDQFRQNWSSDIQNSNSCWNYRIFKTAHKLENYLIKLPPPPPSLWHHLCKFRTGNTRLPIVIGRYDNSEREDRLCSFCNSGIGDEFHYIFKCSHFNLESASLFDTSVI